MAESRGVYTASDVADEFRVSARTITAIARANGIGAYFGGRAGWRFNDVDKQRLWAVMRPPTPVRLPRRPKGRRSH